MQNRLTLLCCVLFCFGMAACTTAPQVLRPDHLFNDQLFPAPTVRINADDVFALSEEMKHYLHTDIAKQLKSRGRQYGLFDALYSKGQLKLEYDAELTRNAAETFAARSGNCL